MSCMFRIDLFLKLDKKRTLSNQNLKQFSNFVTQM